MNIVFQLRLLLNIGKKFPYDGCIISLECNPSPNVLLMVVVLETLEKLSQDGFPSLQLFGWDKPSHDFISVIGGGC